LTLTKEIQQTICKSEIQKGNLVAENLTYFFTGELDVASVNKSGYVSEFEVKVSRSDFKADAKKRKWQYYEYCLQHPLTTRARVSNYFTYVCPASDKPIITENELAPYMGLIYVAEDGRLTIIRKPKLIHKYKHDIVKLLTKMLTVNNWKAYFGAQRLTIMMRELAKHNDEILNEKFNNTVKHLPRL
jgi:hypothetical protein